MTFSRLEVKPNMYLRLCKLKEKKLLQNESGQDTVLATSGL